jgi:hypothetical protein
MTTTNIILIRERRLKVFNQLIYNRLKRLPPGEFAAHDVFYLGLLLSKGTKIIGYLEEVSLGSAFEDKSSFNIVENTFRSLVGINLSLAALDLNTSLFLD